VRHTQSHHQMVRCLVMLATCSDRCFQSDHRDDGAATRRKSAALRQAADGRYRAADPDWDLVASIARQFPQHIVPAFGMHPWYACCAPGTAWLQQLETLLVAFPHAVVGEVGLDKLKGGVASELLPLLGGCGSDNGNAVTSHPPAASAAARLGLQSEVLRAQLALAAKLGGRAISVHCVQASGALLDLLQKFPTEVDVASASDGSRRRGDIGDIDVGGSVGGEGGGADSSGVSGEGGGDGSGVSSGADGRGGRDSSSSRRGAGGPQEAVVLRIALHSFSGSADFAKSLLKLEQQRRGGARRRRRGSGSGSDGDSSTSTSTSTSRSPCVRPVHFEFYFGFSAAVNCGCQAPSLVAPAPTDATMTVETAASQATPTVLSHDAATEHADVVMAAREVAPPFPVAGAASETPAPAQQPQAAPAPAPTPAPNAPSPSLSPAAAAATASSLTAAAAGAAPTAAKATSASGNSSRDQPQWPQHSGDGKKLSQLRHVVALLPADRLLLETDRGSLGPLLEADLQQLCVVRRGGVMVTVSFVLRCATAVVPLFLSQLMLLVRVVCG
jgi:Tat protein secretion system quality control protein TatD with DNase activity